MARSIFYACLLAVSICTPLSAQEKGVPADFKIVLHSAAAWATALTVTITADGTATHETKPWGDRMGKGSESVPPEQPEKKTSKLSKKDVEELFTKVNAADFPALKPRYLPKDVKVFDSVHYFLTVTSNEKNYNVEVYAPGFHKGDAEVQRFLTVWNEVLHMVPNAAPTTPVAGAVVPNDRK